MQSTNLAARRLGHGLALALGGASLVGGIAALMTSLPKTMGVTMLVVGSLFAVFVERWMRYSRAAWSFLIAILVVFETVTFFGAPKIGHVLGISIATAALIPVVKMIAVIALIAVRRDYRLDQKSQSAAL